MESLWLEDLKNHIKNEKVSKDKDTPFFLKIFSSNGNDKN